MSSSSANTRLSKTQLSKMVQFGRFLLPDILPFKLVNSVTNSFVKESIITCFKKLSNDFVVDAGLNIINKNVKKGISSIKSSGITLANN